MSRIEEIKDIGYKIILPELEKFDKEIVCKLQQPLKIKFIKQEDELFNDI